MIRREENENCTLKSAFPAERIIEKDRVWTENWSRTQWEGRISLEDFTPFERKKGTWFTLLFHAPLRC